MTWSHRFHLALGVAFLAAANLTCNGDPPTPPPPGEPAQLAITTQPSSAVQNGQVFPVQPLIQVQDEEGADIAPPSGTTVTAEIASGTGTLGGTLTQTVDGTGKVTFTDLQLSGPPGTYRLQFTSDGLDQATSDDIVLGSEAQASIVVTTQPPGTALTGEVFDPTEQPVVEVKDADGNPVPGVEVTASVASGGGTLAGETSATTDAAGAAAFADLGITGTGAHMIGFAAGPVTGVSSTITLSALPPEATSGRWDPPVSWDIIPLHLNLLPTGKILAWGKLEQGGTFGQPRLWDPSSGAPTSGVLVANDTMLFCAGHTLMADGRLMVSGGHKLDDRGLDVTNIFDPVSGSWVTGLPKMAKGRWYPTVTTLPDGRLVTVAGKDTTKTVVLIPEIWESNQWVQLPGASLSLPYYPRDFVAPDGRIFYAGERIVSRWLEVDASSGGGRGRWTSGPSHLWPFNRDYGSAAMYDDGKILYVGGGGDLGWDTPDARDAQPTATAEKIDLNQGSPAWTSAGSMSSRRRHLNSTILPDGQVLVTGGLSTGEFNDLSGGVRAAEVWNPATNDWTTLASSSIVRGYHAVSLLLPDGTVLHGASGDADIPGTTTPYPAQRNHEIFRPPYLFKGARPTIASAPATVGYGASFTVQTPNAAQVTEVRWIRLGSVTHAFDMNARANRLQFASTGGGLSVTAPSNANLAPPGHYLLFILNRNGVPSTGRVVQIQ